MTWASPRQRTEEREKWGEANPFTVLLMRALIAPKFTLHGLRADYATQHKARYSALAELHLGKKKKEDMGEPSEVPRRSSSG